MHRIRYLCLVFEGLLGGLAGAFLSTSIVNMFFPGMSASRGWIAVALVPFSRWHPIGITIGAFIFGLLESIGQSIQIVYLDVPYQIFLMMPFLVTVIALALASRWAARPQALGKPFKSWIGD